MRIDKWLWAARFFKTRSLAAKACERGKIGIGGQSAKASREVRPGDPLRVKTEAGDFHIHALNLAETRGPATAAQSLYQETEASQALRLKAAEEHRAAVQSGEWSPGKPSKRDRFRAKIHPFRD